MKDEIKVILEAYKKAFKSYYRNNKIVDLGDSVGFKFDWILIRLDEGLPALGFSSPPYRLSKFTIIYVAKGEGDKTIESIRVPVKNRTLMVVCI